MRTRRVLLLILAASLLPAFAKQAWDVDDTSWGFSEAKILLTGKAKGIGKLKAVGLSDGGVTLNGDGSWSIAFAGEEIAAGTWAVEDEFDKSLELTLSPEGQTTLFTFIQDTIEELAALQGEVVDVSLDTLLLEKVRLFLKPNFKLQTARLKVVAIVRAGGFADADGLLDVPATCRVKLTGLSDELPLADVLP